MISFSLWVSFDIIFLVVFLKMKLDFIFLYENCDWWSFNKHQKAFRYVQNVYFNCAKCHWNKCIRRDMFHIIWILPGQFVSLFLRCWPPHLFYSMFSKHEKLHDLHIVHPSHLNSFYALYFAILFLNSIGNIIVSTFVSCLSKPFAPRWISNWIIYFACKRIWLSVCSC